MFYPKLIDELSFTAEEKQEWKGGLNLIRYKNYITANKEILQKGV